MRSRRSRHKPQADDTSHWISFTDLMSALLLIFILAVAILAMNLGQQQATMASQQDEFSEQVGELRTAEKVRAEMLLEAQANLKETGIEVKVTHNDTVLSIPTETLGFDTGEFDIRKENQDVALTIGRVVSDTIRKDDRMKYLDTVFVEGHTDNADFNGLEGTGNWGLSTFRAISLWQLWEGKLPPANKLGILQGQDSQPLFSVSGYSDTRPANDSQKTAAQKAANRRIDLRFTIVRPASEVLEEIEQGYSETDDE